MKVGSCISKSVKKFRGDHYISSSHPHQWNTGSTGAFIFVEWQILLNVHILGSRDTKKRLEPPTQAREHTSDKKKRFGDVAKYFPTAHIHASSTREYRQGLLLLALRRLHLGSFFHAGVIYWLPVPYAQLYGPREANSMKYALKIASSIPASVHRLCQGAFIVYRLYACNTTPTCPR